LIDVHREESMDRVRPAVAADVDALARLRYEFRVSLDAAREPEEAFLERCRGWMRARLSGSGGWHCWVAGDRPALWGTVWLQWIAKLPNPVGEPEWHAYVTNLFVRPSQRERGLGSALLAAAIRECEARRVDAVILWPTPRSRGLYVRHGFSVREDLLERRLAGEEVPTLAGRG
jgi:GNAT superfamily N-acetyltransferase